jgi:uncharacterized protein
MLRETEKINGQVFDTLIDVAQLMKEPIGSTRSYDVDGTVDAQVEGVMRGSVKLIHTDRGVLAQCALKAQVKLACSRCLETFRHCLAFTIEEEFLLTINTYSDVVDPSGEESDELTIDDRNILDLGELIRQYTLLSLPMKPLCRSDCSGIKEMNSYGAT